jgi:hypothetical protein
MKTYFRLIALASLTLAITACAFGADDSVAGKWKAEFDSQIGQQKYTFLFKVDGTNLTGKATGERSIGTNTVDIIEGKVTKDEVSFVEPVKFQDNDLRVEYKGKIADGELKLHRKVGDLAEYDIVAKRVTEADAKPAGSAGTNAPAAKP